MWLALDRNPGPVRSKTDYLLRRPDLEKAHRRRVAQRTQQERNDKRRDMQRVAIRRLQQREALLRRRQKNWAAATQMAGVRPDTASHAFDVTQRTQGHGVKDWKFYRRQGAIWTDLAHTPLDRIHLVAPSQVVKADTEAAERITQKIVEELTVEAAVEEMQIRRARATRELFNSRRAERRAVLEATISRRVMPTPGTARTASPAAATRSRRQRPHSAAPRTRARHRTSGQVARPPSTASGPRSGQHGRTVRPNSQRTNRLAQPRKLTLPRGRFVSVDYKGLLVADDTVRALIAAGLERESPSPPRQSERQGGTRVGFRQGSRQHLPSYGEFSDEEAEEADGDDDGRAREGDDRAVPEQLSPRAGAGAGVGAGGDKAKRGRPITAPALRMRARARVTDDDDGAQDGSSYRPSARRQVEEVGASPRSQSSSTRRWRGHGGGSAARQAGLHVSGRVSVETQPGPVEIAQSTITTTHELPPSRFATTSVASGTGGGGAAAAGTAAGAGVGPLSSERPLQDSVLAFSPSEVMYTAAEMRNFDQRIEQNDEHMFQKQGPHRFPGNTPRA